MERQVHMRILTLVVVFNLLFFGCGESKTFQNTITDPSNTPPDVAMDTTDPDAPDEKESIWEGWLKNNYKRSHWVVRGRVEEAVGYLGKDDFGNELGKSTVKILVEEIFKGTLNGDILTFGAYGAIIGDEAYIVSLSPLFVKGEEVIAFVGFNINKKPFVLVGAPGAKLSVKPDGILVPSSITLNEFRQLIRVETTP